MLRGGVIDPDQDDPAMHSERINRTVVDENFIIALSPCGTACQYAARVVLLTCLNPNASPVPTPRDSSTTSPDNTSRWGNQGI
jgi:hypothetical protein